MISFTSVCSLVGLDAAAQPDLDPEGKFKCALETGKEMLGLELKAFR